MSSIVIAQGGGPTAVINQTLIGAVIESRRLDPKIRILGARYGVRGLVHRDFADLTDVPEADLLRVGDMPNSALGTTRDKPSGDTTAKILEALRSVEAKGFIYIGGNDTASTLDLLRKEAGGGSTFVHAPKTIDNDLVENDHTPGFISAALFVSRAIVSGDLDFRAMPGIYVCIIMGRHAGFLTASASTWRESPSEAPHLIYVPERPFSVEQFLDEVAAARDRFGRCIVAMSEGVQDTEGRALAEVVAQGTVERDAHGNVHLGGGDLGSAIQRALKGRFPRDRTRVDTFGYLPRSFLGLADETDRIEAFDVGRMAARSARESDGSVVLRFEDGATTLGLVDLDAVAGKTRTMPEAFLTAGGNTVSEEGLDYFRRLLPPRPDVFTPFV